MIGQVTDKNLQTNNKRLGEIQIGDKVDVRDKEYIWCIGQVKMIIESAKREPVLLIHYLGFDESKDEVLFQNSPRLAKLGTYTTRSDIPSYERNEDGSVIIRNSLVSHT